MYVYDALGKLAAEYSTARGSFLCGTCYLSYDHLGSVRMVTDSGLGVLFRHDYLPFGEELAELSTCRARADRRASHCRAASLRPLCPQRQHALQVARENLPGLLFVQS